MDWFLEKAEIPEGLRKMFADSRVSLSLADYREPDCPLVGVNSAFCDLSGYSAAEVLGRNCRFLQPEGGAGPVRARIRSFLEDASVGSAKFVISNVRKDGGGFLNLVYMSKLTLDGEVALILGSQFAIPEIVAQQADLYDRALSEDLRKIDRLTRETNWVVLGSFDALASSHSLIAQARIG